MDCYVLVEIEKDGMTQVVFEGHVWLGDEVSPAALQRALEDAAFGLGFDDDDITCRVDPHEPEYDYDIPSKEWLDRAAREILLESGDITAEEDR